MQLEVQQEEKPVHPVSDASARNLEQARAAIQSMLDGMACEPPVQLLAYVEDGADCCVYFPLSSAAKEFHEQALATALPLKLTARFTLEDYCIKEPRDGYPAPVPVESLAVCWQALPLEHSERGCRAFSALLFSGAALFAAIAYALHILYPSLLKELLSECEALF
jgi:hypothetical protein